LQDPAILDFFDPEAQWPTLHYGDTVALVRAVYQSGTICTQTMTNPGKGRTEKGEIFLSAPVVFSRGLTAVTGGETSLNL